MLQGLLGIHIDDTDENATERNQFQSIVTTGSHIKMIDSLNCHKWYHHSCKKGPQNSLC